MEKLNCKSKLVTKQEKKKGIEVMSKQMKPNTQVNKKKGASGITLIALIITIVILIILATVTINVAFGEGGLIEKAQQAKNLTEQATRNEQESLNSIMKQFNEIMSGEGDIENPNTNETTPDEPEPEEPTVENTLKAGDYVTYPSAQGDIECRVLYDSTSEYGVQLITSACVGNDVTLGDSDFTTSMNSYNNAISTLNSAAEAYNNSDYSTARCVGSNPTTPSAEAGYYTFTEFSSSYSGKLKDADTNYETDYNQMEALEINNIADAYWLASRAVYSDSYRSDFYVRYVGTSGGVYDNYLCRVHSFGDAYANANNYSYGLRPVFTLKSGIKVTGGNGESGTPYTLGL